MKKSEVVFLVIFMVLIFVAVAKESQENQKQRKVINRLAAEVADQQKTIDLLLESDLLTNNVLQTLLSY